jgi:hypothetical protein
MPGRSGDGAIGLQVITKDGPTYFPLMIGEIIEIGIFGLGIIVGIRAINEIRGKRSRETSVQAKKVAILLVRLDWS